MNEIVKRFLLADDTFMPEMHLKQPGLFTLWCNGLVVKSLDSQPRGLVFKSTGWLQGRLTFSFF